MVSRILGFTALAAVVLVPFWIACYQIGEAIARHQATPLIIILQPAPGK